MRDWIWFASQKPYGCVDLVRGRLNLRFPIDDESAESPHYWDRERSGLAYNTADNRVVEIVDALLDVIPPSRLAEDMNPLRRLFHTDHRARLQKILIEADAVYQVSSDGRSLLRRSSGAVSAVHKRAVADIQVTTNTGSADLFLAAAWESLHGPHVDPPKAYSEAIKAVEAAAHASIEPNNRRATLGTMLRCLENNPQKLMLALPGPAGDGDITALIEMMKLLWRGQRSRQAPRHRRSPRRRSRQGWQWTWPRSSSTGSPAAQPLVDPDNDVAATY